MESNCGIKCCEGNKAQNICVTKTCSSKIGPLICKSMRCQCYANHAKCTLTFDLQKLIKSIQRKAKSSKQMLKQLLQIYDNGIKILSIERQELLNSINESSLSLSKSERQFYQKIMKQQSKSIKSIEVSHVLNSISSNYDPKQIQILRQESMKDIDQIIKKIHKFYKYPQQTEQEQIKQQIQLKPINQQLHLCDQLKYDKIIPSSFGIIMTSKNYQSQGFAQLALFNPPLTDKPKQIQKYKLIIHSSSVLFANSIVFGVCYLNKTKQKDYLINLASKNHGCYLLGNDLSVYSSHQPQKNRKSHQTLRYNSGQIIIQFNPIDSQVIIKTDHRSVTLKIQQRKNDKLCLCVGVMSTIDKVQYLGQILD